MPPKPNLSGAATRLKKELSPRMTQGQLAEQLGVTQQAVSSWLTGRTRPEPDTMSAIEKLLGIPMSAWTTPKKRERRAA